MPAETASQLLPPAEVARRLGVSAHVLKKWRLSGGGPDHIAVSNRTIRYQEADVDAWLEARKVKNQ